MTEPDPNVSPIDPSEPEQAPQSALSPQTAAQARTPSVPRLLVIATLASSCLGVLFAVVLLGLMKELSVGEHQGRVEIRQDIAALRGSIDTLTQTIPTIAEQVKTVANDLRATTEANAAQSKAATAQINAAADGLSAKVIDSVQPMLSKMGVAMIERLDQLNQSLTTTDQLIKTSSQAADERVGTMKTSLDALAKALAETNARSNDLREALLGSMSKMREAQQATPQKNAPTSDVDAELRAINTSIETLSKRIEQLSARVGRGF